MFIIYIIGRGGIKWKGGLYDVHQRSLVFVTALEGRDVYHYFYNPECEICDKYDSLIPHKVLIIKQQQLYKMTV